MISSIREKGAIAIVSAASELMPNGDPDFSKIKYFPSISQLKSEVGNANLHKLLIVLIKNYCSSVNVPEGKNMNEDQMIEAAGFLLDECDNYRIEDYVIMFTLAKRGKLVMERNRSITGRIFDRVDIQLISEFKSNYDLLRRQGEDSIREEELRIIESSVKADERDKPDEPDEVKKERWDKVLETFKLMVEQGQKEREKEYKKKREEQQQRQMEMLDQMIEKAEKEGYKGPFVDLKRFIKKEGK